MKKQTLSNMSVGTHTSHITKIAESEISQKYLLATLGSSPDKINICDSAHLPIAIITDEATEGNIVDIALLGSPDTLNAVSSGTIDAGDILIPAESGKVQALPQPSETAATYTMIGIALSSTTADNGIIEFMSCVPQQYTILAKS